MQEIEPTLAVQRCIADKRVLGDTVGAWNYNLVHDILPFAGSRNPKQVEQNAQAPGWRPVNEETRDLDAVSYRGKRTKLWQQGEILVLGCVCSK